MQNYVRFWRGGGRMARFWPKTLRDKQRLMASKLMALEAFVESQLVGEFV